MNNFHEILINQLAKEGSFVTDDGELKKFIIIDAAFNMNRTLIGLLLTKSELKQKFFTEIAGHWVFDINLFVQYMENKNFLKDSYTRYRNKIGLNIGGKFLNQRNEVSLVWPFKDCILEGGQSRDDQKRPEIFFNEILAQEEIDQLTEPKVLTNWKRYTVEGEKPVTELKRENGTIKENLIIKGNNLLALHSLLPQFEEKVKLIYIDPPYNTGSVANTFAYNNTFNHSTWLTFMKNRIEIAKVLLKKDGAICIAIDDEEYAHLKLLCDEVFGRENYLGTIVVQSNPRGRTINSFFATCHEYSLVYAKDVTQAIVNNLALTVEQEDNFGEADGNGKFRYLPFRRSGGTSTPEERPNSEFSLYYSKSTQNIIAVGGERITDKSENYKPKHIFTLNAKNEIVKNEPNLFLNDFLNDIIEILPIDILGKRRVWRWSDREEILKAAKNNDFKIIIDKDKFTVQLKDRIKDGRKPKTIWSDSKYDASANGTMLIKKMFDGEKIFSYPKSLYTVKDTVQILTNIDSDDIVLDFFGGSGTTAQAVLELNKEDEGNRRFIICEQMDYINIVTVPRIKKVIDNNQEGGLVYCELKKYNQTFIEQIEEAQKSEQLLAIWDKMKVHSFLNYNVDIKKQDEAIDDFKQLSIETQKQHLCEILNKNQLYVNLSSIDDEDYQVSDDDKRLTRDFYAIKEEQEAVQTKVDL